MLHGGFFLGPGAFYGRLREMSVQERQRINMTHISFVNNLYGQETLKRYQRRNARFMNAVFSATLMGAAVSDQLEDGRTLSGVGGQYNFVVQGHELQGARSILMLRAWRERGGDASSNLIWNYGHTTIPRHLRDVYVTEYGIADVRGRPDNEVIARMLAIADSRFQEDLLEQAQKAGKISADYVIPEQHRNNTPERLQAVRKQAASNTFPLFPLGCDFDAVEQRLLPALSWLKEKMSHRDYLALGRGALGDHESVAEKFSPMLARMGLEIPSGVRERLFRRLLLAALEASEPA
jgi:acyl-CoA hydrolase